MNTQEDANRVNAAFSRVELLAIIFLVALMAQLQVAALNKSNTKAQRVLCLNNLSRQIRAWQLYSEDNGGRLIMSLHGGTGVGPGLATWTQGWLTWGLSSDNTNTLFLTSDDYSKVAVYLGRDVNAFHCPSDHFVSMTQATRSWGFRTRSYSQNAGIGDGNAESGPWSGIYQHFKTTADFISPSPRETWVFTEEHADSINDPILFNPRGSQWVDRPAIYHEGATSFAFADGHAEAHIWVGSLQSERARKVTFSDYLTIIPKADDADIEWMKYHGARYSTNGF